MRWQEYMDQIPRRTTTQPLNTRTGPNTTGHTDETDNSID